MMRPENNGRDSGAGFTLIEVLVALAIIAVALMATLRAAGQSVNNVGELRSRLFAGWVAENLLAEQRARGDWPSPGVYRGSVRQGNIDFIWREEVIETRNPAFRKVDIYVFEAPGGSQLFAHLTGFLVQTEGMVR